MERRRVCSDINTFDLHTGPELASTNRSMVSPSITTYTSQKTVAKYCCCVPLRETTRRLPVYNDEILSVGTKTV